MPKSVWSNEKPPVTLISPASASILAGACSVRVLPCSVIATFKVTSPRIVFVPLTWMSANGNFSASRTFSSMLARVPSMSDSVGCVSKPAPASSADKNTAARRRALERISAGLAQLHLEFHLHVGADDIGLRPLARADAERAALHSQLAFHHGAVGGSRPAERHFDRLVHALQEQRAARHVTIAFDAAQVGRAELGLRKACVVEPVLAADFLVHVRDVHVGARDLDGDIEAAPGGLVRVGAQARVELPELARGRGLLEDGDELELAAGRIHFPVRALSGARREGQDAAQPEHGDDSLHGALQAPGSIRSSTASRLTK